jgi:quercetin dioxygenase-like cupin family protein
MFVPAKSMRDVRAADADVRAVLVYVPGGREGTARAGALEARDASKGEGKTKLLRASEAKTYGPATIYLDDTLLKGTPLAASVLQLPAGATVAEHVHAKETEMLYVLAGSGTMTVAGVQLPVTSTSVVQIPMNTKHSFTAKDAVKAVQIYTPAGPEQRFKK